jgi:hypothetical protein
VKQGSSGLENADMVSAETSLAKSAGAVDEARLF